MSIYQPLSHAITYRNEVQRKQMTSGHVCLMTAQAQGRSKRHAYLHGVAGLLSLAHQLLHTTDQRRQTTYLIQHTPQVQV